MGWKEPSDFETPAEADARKMGGREGRNSLVSRGVTLPRIYALLLILATYMLGSLWDTRYLTSHCNKAHNGLEQPSHASGLEVTFDKYSLMLGGKRVFIHSGEFHTFRLPVPSLWPDILQKTKAAGLNALSVYTHMGLINPSRGVIDLDGYRAIEPLFKAAMDAGLWIVLRPGPYINAETTAGGIAHWATSEVAGQLRSNASDWREAWEPYIKAIIEETLPYQVTNGGPVIDNEYEQDIGGEYFQDLIDYYHEHGLSIPLTYNDPNQGRNFINGTGAADLYGLDGYPQRFDCSNPTKWNPVVLNYHQYHEEVNPSQPWYIPEFQAGAFDAWGPSSPGYQACQQLTDANFMSVFNLQLWASNAKLINYYMLYGGTSWGALPFPGVYTSYDYGAPITESRLLTPKYDELKRQGIFLRSSPEFYKTDWVADTSTGLAVSSNPQIFTTHLRNPDSGASFYIIRHNDSTSSARQEFKLTLDGVSGEKLQIPISASNLTLSGRQSKTIVTSYSFGSKSKLQYSTGQIFFAGVIDDRDVLFIYGDSDQEHEFALELTGTPNPFFAPSSEASLSEAEKGWTVISTLSGFEGFLTVYDSDTQLILYADTKTTATFWSPTISSSSPFGNFWDFGTNRTVLIGGPYLTRGASIDTKGRLALTGDLKGDAMLTLIGTKGITGITWNGNDIGGDSLASGVGNGILSMKLLASSSLASDVVIPKLGDWKFADSLPEVGEDYDDDSWVNANKRETNIASPHYGDGRSLYGCDYGFCENVVLWRGHFQDDKQESVNLSINGGNAFAASVWLNDVFLKTTYGNSTNHRNDIEETDEKYIFPAGSVLQGQDNVLTIVQDNMGLEESEETPDSSKSPRGIRGFQLNPGTFTSWKVQGKVGGYSGYPDKLRGVFNEGGLYGERAGWHLPGYDTSTWSTRSSLALDGAGIGFFVTTFPLNIGGHLDAMLSFTFKEELGLEYRAYIYVNGWMMGKRVGNIGPQAKFPVPQGILDYTGTNTIAVAVWNMQGKRVEPILRLELDDVLEGGIGNVEVNNPGWSSRGREN